MEIWGAFQGLEEEGDAWEGLTEGKDLCLERGLFLGECGAGQGQLGPGVENFGGLESDF